MKIKNVHIGQYLKFKKSHALRGEVVKVIDFSNDGSVKFKDIGGSLFWDIATI